MPPTKAQSAALARGRKIRGRRVAATKGFAEFQEAVLKFANELVPEEIITLQRHIALNAINAIVMRTPVDTGRARANWQVTIGNPTTEVLVTEDKQGSGTIAKAMQVIEAIPPFDIVWITNNVPYIEVLEYGLFNPPNPGPSKDKRQDRFGEILVVDGYSKQAPQGILSVTIAELRTMFP